MEYFKGYPFQLIQAIIFCCFVPSSLCYCGYGNAYRPEPDQNIIEIKINDNITHGSVVWNYEILEGHIEDN